MYQIYSAFARRYLNQIMLFHIISPLHLYLYNNPFSDCQCRMPKISLFLQIKNKKVRVSHFISHSTNSLLKVSNGFDFLHPLPKRHRHSLSKCRASAACYTCKGYDDKVLTLIVYGIYGS